MFLIGGGGGGGTHDHPSGSAPEYCSADSTPCTRWISRGSKDKKEKETIYLFNEYNWEFIIRPSEGACQPPRTNKN